MKEFLIYVLKSGICISIFLIVYHFLLRPTTFFKFNRIFLLFGLVASFLIPLTVYTYDVVIPSLPQALVVDNISTIENIVQEKEKSVDWWQVFGVIFLLGFGVELGLRLRGYQKLAKFMTQKGERTSSGFTVVFDEKIKTPFSLFNKIFVNRGRLSDIELDSICKHEQIHVSQKHWIDLICSESALLLQWFNPLMRLYMAYQKENHEYLADSGVIEQGVAPRVYQAVIVNQVFQAPVISLSSSFSYSNPLNRIKMMKKAKTSQWRKLSILVLLPAFFLFSWTFAEANYIQQPQSLFLSSDDANSKNDKPSLILLENKEISYDQMQTIDPSTIESVNVYKGDTAVTLYGDKAKDGVILIKIKDVSSQNNNNSPSVDAITLSSSDSRVEEGSVGNIHVKLANTDKSATVVSSDGSSKSKNIIISFTGNLKEGDPLYIIDDQIADGDMLKKLNPNIIERIDVLKNESAVDYYGDKAKNGVVIIMTKSNPQSRTISLSDNVSAASSEPDPVFIVDGKEVDSKVYIDLKPENIESINVVKDKTGKGKTGVVIVKTQKEK